MTVGVPPEGLDLGGAESLYRALVEEMPAIVYIDSHDPHPESLYVSPQVTLILGYLPEEWMADPTLWPRVIHPDDRDWVRTEWRQAVETRAAFHAEYRLIRRDGVEVWVSDEARLIVDQGGAPRFWQGVIVDITDRQLAERSARETEARHQALVEGIPAVVYEMGPDDERRTLYVSRHVEEVLGYSQAEWLEQPDIWTELLHPDDREVQLAAHDLHNETGEPWSREYRLIASDGREVWVRDVATLVRDEGGRPLTWQGVMLDVTPQKVAETALRRANDELELRVASRTAELEEANEMMSLEIDERRRAESQLREAEERYRLLIERLPAVVYVWDVIVDGSASEHYSSPMIEGLVGYTSEEWTASTEFWEGRLHPHDRTRVLAQMLRCESTGEPFREEYRLLAKDGHVVWVHDQATLMRRDPDGRPRLFQGFLVDISDRKAAEEKATAAEERYRVLTEEGPVIAYAFGLDHERTDDPSVDMRYVSPRIKAVLGYDAAVWTEHPDLWIEKVHPDDRARLSARWAGVRATGGPWSYDYRMLAADGKVVWLHDEGRAIEHDDRGRPVLCQGILLDMTERLERESDLRAEASRYRDLVEAMPAIPWSESVDATTGTPRMTFIGPQVEEILGWTARELLDEPGHFERLVHPDDRERVMGYVERLRRGGDTRWRIRYRVIAKDGRSVTLQSHGTAVLDANGRLQGWRGLAVEVDGVEDAVAPEVTKREPSIDLSR